MNNEINKRRIGKQLHIHKSYKIVLWRKTWAELYICRCHVGWCQENDFNEKIPPYNLSFKKHMNTLRYITYNFQEVKLFQSQLFDTYDVIFLNTRYRSDQAGSLSVVCTTAKT
jgi:hypothetical protein